MGKKELFEEMLKIFSGKHRDIIDKDIEKSSN